MPELNFSILPDQPGSKEPNEIDFSILSDQPGQPEIKQLTPEVEERSIMPPEIRQGKPEIFKNIIEMFPGTTYLTKEGRKLAKNNLTLTGEPIQSGANTRFLEATKAGDWLVGGEFGLEFVGRKMLAKAPKALGKKGKVTKKQSDQIMELIRARRAGIDIGSLRSESFIRNIEQQFSPLELEAIPFIRQGIKDPKVLEKIGKKDLIPIIKNPPQDLLDTTEAIGRYYDEGFDFLRKHWGEDLGYVENYVTQLWDIPKNKRADVVNYFATKNPFTNKRKIPSLEEGIKFGLTPKTTNIAELLRIYDQYKIKTAYNFRFANSLKKLKDADGNPLIMRSDKAPDGWVLVDNPSLRRAIAIGKPKGKEGVILTKIPVKVHPEIAKEIDLIFGSRYKFPGSGAINTVNAFTKKSILSLSLFHPAALTESAFSTGIGKRAMKLWDPRKVKNALKHGDLEIFKQMPLAEDAINHGVKFGALGDVQKTKVTRSLKNAEFKLRKVPMIGKAMKGIRKANDLWDTALWDYYHNTLKLYAYESNVENALKSASKKLGRDLEPIEVKGIKREMASFTNDSFGGQNWELNKILGNPKMQQFLHYLFLAPDWTFSVLKQGIAPAKGVGKSVLGDSLRGQALTKQSVKFWAKAALYYNLIAQSINYYNTKKEYGKGRFTWENAPGNKLNIFAGYNEDGTERYIRMGKQFREVVEWGEDPIMKLGAKLTPTLRESIRQVAKHDPGSGFPTEWEDKTFWDSLPERFKSVAEMPLPFSIRPYVESRPHNFLFTFPAKKGMTRYGAVKEFKKAINKGDLTQVRWIYINALRNHLPASTLFETAKTSIKSKMTIDDKSIAREIFHEVRRLPEDKQIDALRTYQENGILTPGILEQYIKVRNEFQETLMERQLMLQK